MYPIVFKCTACDEFAPCYFQCDKAFTRDIAGFGEDYVCCPTECPHGNAAAWRELTPDQPERLSSTEDLGEWLSGAGYENCPEEIRDEIICFGISRAFDSDKVRQAFGLLIDYDRHYISHQELTKEFDRIKKLEIVAAVYVEAFRAGIIWREKYLQEHGK